jgi:hypothetical protein
MKLTGAAEHLFVSKHPEVPALMRERMRTAAQAPPARGRSARLAGLVPPRFPVLGPVVWRSAEQRWLQELAPSFLEGWDEAEAQATSGAAASTSR